jgi:molecular chaperone HtpG
MEQMLKLKHLTNIGEAKVEYGNPIIEVKLTKKEKLHIIDQGIGMTSQRLKNTSTNLLFLVLKNFLENTKTIKQGFRNHWSFWSYFALW